MSLHFFVKQNLTGGSKDGIHVTDVTNASRTLLMNIDTLYWDPLLTKTFGINPEMLPEIRSSSEIVGSVSNGSLLDGIPISAILANQQASLVGQMCMKQGMVKNSYRSGCFLLVNTGEEKVFSTHGLVTTIAYKMGSNAPAIYALEGSVAVAGSALKWLQNNLNILKKPEDSEHVMAYSTINNRDILIILFSSQEVFFLPVMFTSCLPLRDCTHRTGAKMPAELSAV